MKLCTVGLGYIGLPTSIMFAKHDYDVVGVDVNKKAVDLLNSGKIHIEEPGLQEALDKVLVNDKFKASLIPEEADVFIVAVPTPNNYDEFKSCDLTYVKQAINSIIPFLRKGNTIIVESTIAPRSMEDHIKPLLEQEGITIGDDIYLVHCPERVLPGRIMEELIYNNRIVGGVTPECTEKGADVYRAFVKGEIIKTTSKTAEMSKLMENTYRDVNIALANEVTQICNELDINALEVIEMANKHPRVNIHSPGPGVGGHCLAVDPYFIISNAPKSSHLIQQARALNTSMPNYIVNYINELMDLVNGEKVTILGVAYKGNVDDTRESPAMEIYNTLLTEGKYQVSVYDPHVTKDYIENNIESALDNSSLVVVLTDHVEFKTLKPTGLNHMKHKRIFDTKNSVDMVPSEADYMNLGNVFQYVKKETVTI